MLLLHIDQLSVFINICKKNQIISIQVHAVFNERVCIFLDAGNELLNVEKINNREKYREWKDVAAPAMMQMAFDRQPFRTHKVLFAH